ncbi:methylenetetrahydrofolate reductase [Aquihabitans daechungensis]|uniref:methylenetetrahydrofolate reductase n=1 Tax=Aquihabitans daechungensis TaxID=1052257 RepID=UPI003BA13BAC
MTRISDLLAKGPTWSFEFFPPKTPEGMTSFDQAVTDLSALEPAYVSITYGAGGSARDTTYDLVVRVNEEQAFPAMPHLTCVGHTRAELVDLLESYRSQGVDNVLALAGDPPKDGSDPGGDFVYATELVALAREVGEFSVGVAAFPEVHPRSSDRATDRRFLAAKLDAADFGMTQFFWNADHYRVMVEELEALGCTTPVLPGVMPFVSVAGARRMSAMNNTEIPTWLQERMDQVDGDPEATRRLGVEVATEQIQQLLEIGVPGIHLYAMNRAQSIQEIYDNLGLRR